jgi:hypothetical protein
LVSSNVIKLQLEDSIFIHSDICTNGTDNILQEIFAVDSPDYGNIVFQTPDVMAYSKRLVGNKHNVYNFYITDEDSQEIDLNGLNVVFTLLLFKQDDIFARLKDFLKLKILQS